VMDSIRTLMQNVYGYDTGPYEGYLHHTDNDKLIVKLDWNPNPSNTLSLRWDYLNAKRDLPPHPFVLSYNNTGRGPNATSLPFANSGYAINNHLNSFALELNSRSRGFANRFFASYNRFRDFREPFSKPFPTIEIGDGGVTYTTVGHEPFSIHNILDQDVWQLTDNFSWFRGKHVVPLGANFAKFSFFNSFNIFRHPMYFTNPVDNPFSRSLTALDANGNPEIVDQSKLPNAAALWSPRLGFNWNASGDRRTQVRGGTGIFTGRVPFVWIGNVLSNPGANPNLYPVGPLRPTGSPGDSSTLAQSFDVNAVNPKFKWPQVWTTDVAVDHELPGGLLGTLELISSKAVHAIIMRNADLRAPVGNLPAPDGRPYFGGAGNNSLNPSLAGGGIYVLDNTSDGHSINVTAQLRKNFASGLSTRLGYSFTDARNNLKSTEIASVLRQNEPVTVDRNKPQLVYTDFCRG